MTRLDELQWLEMASVRFWARVYEVKALTNCTLEQAIQAVQTADRSMPNETSRLDTHFTNLRGDNHRISP